MGVADGPVFAPWPKGTDPEKMIVSPPCPCPECVAGPGITPAVRHEERVVRALGPITKVVTMDWCPSCMDVVEVTSVRQGPGWHNLCAHSHTWQSFD